MVRVGALDHPVERSSHTVPTPKGGGVGIVAAMVLGGLWFGHAAGSAAMAVPLAALFLGVISYLDDLYNWPFLAKLAAQVAAAAGFMAAGGVVRSLNLPPFGVVDLGIAGPVLTLGWILFVTNAVNFMDGLNGLASGSVALAGLAFLVTAPASMGVLALPLVAGIAGFLPFNYPSARIFMGDVGSQPAGFAVSALVVLGASGGPQQGALMLVAVPLVLLPMLADVAFTLVRRARSGARLTQAHRSHLYQVANRAGMPAWRVTLIYWGMAAGCGALGLWASGAAMASFASGTAGAGVIILAASGAAALTGFGLWALYVARRAARAGITVW